MNKDKSLRSSYTLLIIFFIVVVFGIILISSVLSENNVNLGSFMKQSKEFKILTTDEAVDICDILDKYGKEKGYNITVETCNGSLDMIDILNNGSKYDAVFLSNSIWTSMLDTTVVSMSDYETVSINPVVFGVKKSLAKELGLIKDDLKLEDIVKVIKEGKLTFAMPSGTQTNTGASSLLGFVNVLCGNPEVLTYEDLKNDELTKELTSLFSGVNRSSGSESFIEKMYLDKKCDAAILYETSVININKNIKNDDDFIYALYPVDGVSISDLLFGMTNSKDEAKKIIYDDLKAYLLSNEVKNKLEEKGHRVWYGGINKDADKSVFNPNWGIDTSRYITATKYPAMGVIKEVFALYQSELRKPTHTVFVLDYSGSMYGEGHRQLSAAMEYILGEEASKDYLQFTDNDIVTIIPFSTSVIDIYSTSKNDTLDSLITKIKNTKVSGGTNIYDAVTYALNELATEDSENYNMTIVVMTDGEGNGGSKSTMEARYKFLNRDIPVYSILFGDASEKQMKEIADFTGGKVFDGKNNLKYAFKLVRGYN